MLFKIKNPQLFFKFGHKKKLKKNVNKYTKKKERKMKKINTKSLQSYKTIDLLRQHNKKLNK